MMFTDKSTMLITGGDGFIGKSAALYFSKKYNILSTNRKTLDVTNSVMVDEFFIKNKIDIVLHTAAVGGRRNQNNEEEYFHKNIKMYENLKKYRDKFKLMIVFGSGAEYCKEKNIEKVDEAEFDSRVPLNHYGRAKQEIAKNIIDINDNIYNIRIFNCFGVNEEPQRMIKNSILKYIEKCDIIVHKNKEMDFFYVKDLYRIIEYLISQGGHKFKQFNACYMEKQTLLDIANKINNLDNHSVDISLLDKEMDNSYSGNGARLNSLGLEFIGFDEAIKEYYQEIKKHAKTAS